MTKSCLRTIGLMSGTSMDGIDAAPLETDGEAMLNPGPHASTPYPPELGRVLLSLPAAGVDIACVELTDLQAQAVRELCSAAAIDPATIDLVGFHGQTIKHEPHLRRTCQLGDGQRMADTLGIAVVSLCWRHKSRCPENPEFDPVGVGQRQWLTCADRQSSGPAPGLPPARCRD